MVKKLEKEDLSKTTKVFIHLKPKLDKNTTLQLNTYSTATTVQLHLISIWDTIYLSIYRRV